MMRKAQKRMSSSRLRMLSKNAVILGIGNFSSKILVFFLVPLYTNVLSTLEYGNYDLAITTIQLAAPIITVNISDGVMRFLFEKDKSKSDVATIGFRYLSISCVIFAAFLSLCRYIGWPQFLLENTIWILLYYIGFIFQAYACQLAKGLEKVGDICIAGLIGTVTTIALNIVMLLVLKMGIVGFFVANTLGNIFQVIYYAIRLKIWEYIRVRGHVSGELHKEMVTYSAPLILSSLAWSINNSLDKYMVTSFYGADKSGLLAIAYKIPTILNVCSMFFIQAWQISAIAEYESGDSKKFFSKIYIAFNSIVVVGCSGLIFLTRPISKILYAKEFYEAWQYVPFLLISTCFSVSATFIGPLLSANKDSGSMAKSAIMGAITNVVMNYILIKYVGVLGATVATAISSFVIFSMRKHAAKSLLEFKALRNGYISWCILIVQALLEIKYQNYIVGFVEVIAICILNLKNLLELTRHYLNNENK